MYIAKDGTFIIQYPVFRVKDGIDYLHDDVFHCDSLIAPAIAMLNQKGYQTEFCCQGHIANHSVVNPYDEGTTESHIEVHKDREIYDPYIKFNHNSCSIKNFSKIGLPNGWYAEFYSGVEGSSVITMNDISNERKLPAFDYSIRCDVSVFKRKIETLGDRYTDFDFYRDILNENEKMYKWVCNLPQRRRIRKAKRCIEV